jgi:hypothetical protein
MQARPNPIVNCRPQDGRPRSGYLPLPALGVFVTFGVVATGLGVGLFAGFAAGLPAADRLRAAGLRLAAGFFAAVLAGFAAALARVLLAVDRFADGFFFAVDFRAAGLRAVEDLAARAVPALAVSVSVHLPDIARWTASVTASAISEPSLLALVMTALAACVALSAASRPASRMARRALGLALIAAAAAANPAASISRLIAALAILSTVVSDFLLEPDEDFLVPLAFAIADLL